MFFTYRVDPGIFELHACHADSPLGPWSDHRLNPLTIDIRSSRCGGKPFLYQGNLYRPAQNSSKQYGRAISLCRIEALSPEEFRETIVKIIEPPRHDPYPTGFHTVVGVTDALTIVDGRREFLSLASLVRNIRNLIITNSDDDLSNVRDALSHQTEG